MLLIRRVGRLEPLSAILAPLFAPWEVRASNDFWQNSIAIGYSGLAMMGLQFGLTARFRYVTEPWGRCHLSLPPSGLADRRLSRRGAPLILFVARPELIALLNFCKRLGAPASALSTYSLIAPGNGSVASEPENQYETWHPPHLACRRCHGGILHMVVEVSI
jgi:hypothetical protein